MLGRGGLDPTFVVGGRVNHVGTTARLGRGEYMVVEADESDRTFLLLAPVVAVVTTIDREHLDHYDSLEEIQDIFTQFVNRVPFYGAAVLCLDEPNVQAIIPRVKRPVITYGTSSQADLVISDIELLGLASEFPPDLSRRRSRHSILPGPPGIHNVRNAAAAAAVALYLNVPADLIRAGLENFTGVGRRFDVKGVIDGITLIDDYGHHPGRDSRHARSRARLPLRAPAGALPAAPLHAHPAPVGRFLPRLQSGRHAGADRHLCRGRAAHPAASPPRRWPTPFAPPATRMSSIAARCRRASSICCAKRARATPC